MFWELASMKKSEDLSLKKNLQKFIQSLKCSELKFWALTTTTRTPNEVNNFLCVCVSICFSGIQHWPMDWSL